MESNTIMWIIFGLLLTSIVILLIVRLRHKKKVNPATCKPSCYNASCSKITSDGCGGKCPIQACDGNNTCNGDVCNIKECKSDSDCDGYCNDGKCSPCTANSQCESENCSDGKCDPCTTDSQCGSSELCIGGTCNSPPAIVNTKNWDLYGGLVYKFEFIGGIISKYDSNGLTLTLVHTNQQPPYSNVKAEVITNGFIMTADKDNQFYIVSKAGLISASTLTFTKTSNGYSDLTHGITLVLPV